MTLTGGLRDRLIVDAVYNTVHDALDLLGWFDTGREHAPIVMIGHAVNDHDEIQPNTLAVTSDAVSTDYAELGSELTEDTRTWWVDFYGQPEPYATGDAVGRHIIGDIRDILRGKHPAAGRTAPIIDVWDTTQATPTVAFSLEVQDVVDDRAHDFSKPHQRNWFSVRFDTIGQY